MARSSSVSALAAQALVTNEADPSLNALAARYGLPADARRGLECLLDVLLGDPLAPTAVRERSRVIDDHLADSLVALDLTEVRRARAIADLGSGAGLPGLPLAIALADAQVSVIESARRKAAFLAQTVSRCGLGNVVVVNARAEDVAKSQRRFDVVTARALATLAVVAEYAAPLLRLGGTLVAGRGRRDAESEREAERAAAELGLQIGEVRRVAPYPGALTRHLHLISKVAETPERFPRRPGMALKRPLGR
jgi:16S rRNA (guanine527-N7)-methyltransferase